jgi:4-hydroxyphenylacetate 3-monooxygenase
MKGKLVDGGIVVSGRARWSSGCDHAAWEMIGIKVPNLADAQYPERNFAQYMAMIPSSDYTIDDDSWYSMGMRGSGSKDLIFDNVFVPNRRMERLDALAFGYSSGQGTIDSRVARFPFTMVFPTFLPAVSLGCADGMIEEFNKRQRTRKNNLSGAYGITNHAAYMRLAESEHELEAMSNYYKGLLYEIQSMGDANRLPTESEFWGILAKLNFVTDRVTDIIERLFRGAGASAIADFNPMQRYWRDAHAARLHLGSDYDTSVLQHGRFLIGLPPSAEV